MRLESLSKPKGNKKSKRIGRGQGSGKGGTSTKGHKGAQSRSGYSRNVGFEGGQMPLQRRIPKFGFKNNSKIIMKPINLDLLQKLYDEKGITQINNAVLRSYGFIGKNDLVKILGRGELTKPLHIKCNSFSNNAKQLIENAGGSVAIEKDQ